MKTIITATTFQLTHYDNPFRNHPFKCSFDIGYMVMSPLGIGKITELDKETGKCKMELIKLRK